MMARYSEPETCACKRDEKQTGAMGEGGTDSNGGLDGVDGVDGTWRGMQKLCSNAFADPG
jgi:hypothetical protein